MVLTFPCKPQQLSQDVMLAGARTAMRMTGCASSGMTFALARADVASPQQAEPVLRQLRQAALDNLRGHVLASQPASVPQATPGLAAALELDIEGSGSDGAALREHLLLFAQGATVYQALVLGPAPGFQDEAAHTFTSSIRLSPAHAAAQ